MNNKGFFYDFLLASSERMTATQLYDPGIIVFAGLVTVGMMIAIYGLTVSPGIGSDELATMVAYP